MINVSHAEKLLFIAVGLTEMTGRGEPFQFYCKHSCYGYIIEHY